MTSQDRLRNFLKKEYMDKGGAEDLGIAIRDCLTDLSHLNTETSDDVPLHWRLAAAEDIAENERQEEARQDQEMFSKININKYSKLVKKFLTNEKNMI
jgi:hypothetical protein